MRVLFVGDVVGKPGRQAVAALVPAIKREREIDLVHAAGYGFALTVDAGFNTATTHPLRLRRLGVDDVDGLAELVVKASGLWAFLRRMRGDRRLHLVARRSRIDT